MADPNLVTILKQIQQNQNVLIECLAVLIEHLEQSDELVDELITVAESEGMLFETLPIFDEYPDDEDDGNTVGEPVTRMESFESPFIFDKDFVGDLLMYSNILSLSSNALYLETRANTLFRSKPLCSTNNEVLSSDYNDPFLQPSSKPENAGFVDNNTLAFSMKFEYTLLDKETKSTPLKIEVDSSLLISRVAQRKRGDLLAFYVCAQDLMKHMCRKSNLKSKLYDINLD